MELFAGPLEARRERKSPLFDDDELRDLLDDEDEDEGSRNRGIRCPRCGWTPRARDRWSCLCGHVWNTFDTRGRCPGCDQQWFDTQCLSCGVWSRHDDWYFDEPEEGGS